MLLIGAENDLIIMNFTQCNGQLKQLNKLRRHSHQINSIEIINSDHEIITAGDDNIINIWKKRQQWKLFQSLNSYSYNFNRIIVNKCENLIISYDRKNIKFWNIQNDGWQCIQQIKPFGGDIQQLELNDKCDILFAAKYQFI